MHDLVVVAIQFWFVGEETAEISEESLPVAGNVFHPQVLQDELLTPVRKHTTAVSAPFAVISLSVQTQMLKYVTLRRSPVQCHRSL